jgi:hypothetical protein
LEGLLEPLLSAFKTTDDSFFIFSLSDTFITVSVNNETIITEGYLDMTHETVTIISKIPDEFFSSLQEV